MTTIKIYLAWIAPGILSFGSRQIFLWHFIGAKIEYSTTGPKKICLRRQVKDRCNTTILQGLEVLYEKSMAYLEKGLTFVYEV